MLPRLGNDLVEVLEACIDGNLDKIKLTFEDNAAVCVVLASEGYPEKFEKGLEIEGLSAFDKCKEYYIFHAATRQEKDKILTNGGRVLGVTALGENLKEARSKAYKAAGKFILRINICEMILEKPLIISRIVTT